MNRLALFAALLLGAVAAPSSAATAPSDDPRILQCMYAAASLYQVPLDLLRAIARTEGGRVGTVARNTNGSHDLGVMQINTIHLPMLARYGITRDMLVNDACVNVHVGAWILQRELSRGGDFWFNVGAYNSRTPVHNARYRAKVWANLQKIWKGE